MKRLEVTRREVLARLGGGVLVLAFAPACVAQNRNSGGQANDRIAAWLHIGPEGKVTVFTGKVEVGQDIRTSLTQAVAEELRLPMDAIELVMGDIDRVPFDQGTFGSRTTPTMTPILRRAAASARETLLDLAAVRWSVDRSGLVAEGGTVRGSGHSATYGDLAKDQPFDKPVREVPLTEPKDWKVMGRPMPKVGGRAIVTGRHAYTSDLRRPGMLIAKVLRPSVLGEELVSVDTRAAERMKDVRVVRDGGLVAVAAPTLRQAERALQALQPEWRSTEQPQGDELFEILRGGPLAPNELTQRDGVQLRATYKVPYIAHVPLEPRAALAEWDGSKMTVHTGTQRPFGVRTEVANALGIPESQVRVLVPDTGSGYGGKHSGDAAVEAARIAKALGVPIRLVWTRREEFTFAYFRPAGVIELAASANTDGRLTSWEFTNYNSGGAGVQTPYDVPSPRTQSRQTRSPLRQGSYRALASTFNHFARESAMDELAHELGQDPVAFRLKNLSNERLRAVLEACAKAIGWPGSGKNMGIACGTEKGGYVATAVEIERRQTEFHVVRCVTVFECGAIVNPLHLKSQVDGCVLMGLGGALFEKIDFDKGQIVTDRLSAYRVPRFSDVPQMETILLDRPDLPSAGGSEAPIIAIAPAIANAAFRLTGVRQRTLPLDGILVRPRAT